MTRTWELLATFNKIEVKLGAKTLSINNHAEKAQKIKKKFSENGVTFPDLLTSHGLSLMT